ncbi:Tripeptidyl-peptidase sed2, partial [Termitomyces sp. T112]
MKALSRAGLLYFLALIPFAATSPYKLKERVFPPHGWRQHSTPPADHNIFLRIGLPQPNFNTLKTHLYEVSDPYHPRYGAYLSKEEVDALVAPDQDSIDAVNDWLASHGIQNSDVIRSSAGDWVTIMLPVHMVEKMLDTKYHIWKHDNGNTIVRTTSYSLPEHLHAHIDVIQPTTMFGQLQKMRSTIVWSDEAEIVSSVQNLAPIVNAETGVSVDASCNATITLTCLKQLYNAVGLTPSALNNSIAVTGYLEQFANFQDLQSFYTEQNPAAVNSTFQVVSINGGLNNQTLSQAGAEANLDVQFAFGLAFPIPVMPFV